MRRLIIQMSVFLTTIVAVSCQQDNGSQGNNQSKTSKAQSDAGAATTTANYFGSCDQKSNQTPNAIDGGSISAGTQCIDYYASPSADQSVKKLNQALCKTNSLVTAQWVMTPCTKTENWSCSCSGGGVTSVVRRATGLLKTCSSKCVQGQ